VPQVLGFPDRRSDGAYPVPASDGSVAASIKVAFWGNRFDAFGADGERICSGRAPTLRQTCLAQDAQGRELVAVKPNWGRFVGVTLRLDEVGRLRVKGQRDVVVTTWSQPADRSVQGVRLANRIHHLVEHVADLEVLGREHPGHAQRPQPVGVSFGHDAAEHHRNVIEAGRAEPGQHVGNHGQM
jgi:hypothetical protein